MDDNDYNEDIGSEHELKSNLEADKIEFKPKFVERYEQLTDFEVFKKYSLSFLRRSIRVNTLKISIEELKKRLEKDWYLEQIPWCKEGFWINHKGQGDDYRRDVGNLLEHALGYIYIQEAASMIPPLFMKGKDKNMDNELILDMCASPGSKTTQIAQYMNNTGVLIANDYKGDRISALGINLQRCGLSNHIITLMQGRYFKGFQFDKILVDAPCSGTGTIRKSLKTLRIWNPHAITRLAGQQKVLLETAFNNLKKDGILIYSTCSLEPEEDEGVVSWLLNKYENAIVEPVDLPIKLSKAVMNFDGITFNEQVKHCLRIWPQDNDTEGFFVARIVKK
ncbi:NOL1/NOP2/sun family putative RNA methylase [Candidatus Woesearchaeota archaeon]|nr:NOL1/NOP2/sun family putative RNA methylase [Candidatus Woesearchaeota archaeon]